MDQAYEGKFQLAKRYTMAVESEQVMVKRFDALQESVDALEKGLLRGATPVLATASLQSIVEGVLKPRKIEIKNIKSLKAKERGDFKTVSVEITFYCDTSTLVDVLYDIVDHKGAIYIDFISLRHQGGGVKPRLRVTMRVGAGFTPDDALMVTRKVRRAAL